MLYLPCPWFWTGKGVERWGGDSVSAIIWALIQTAWLCNIDCFSEVLASIGLACYLNRLFSKKEPVCQVKSDLCGWNMICQMYFQYKEKISDDLPCGNSPSTKLFLILCSPLNCWWIMIDHHIIFLYLSLNYFDQPHLS